MGAQGNSVLSGVGFGRGHARTLNLDVSLRPKSGETSHSGGSVPGTWVASMSYWSSHQYLSAPVPALFHSCVVPGLSWKRKVTVVDEYEQST